MYSIKNYYTELSIPEYLEKYVDVPTFLDACKHCPNYDKVWSCPSYDFDVETYWKQYSTICLYGHQILFHEEAKNKSYTTDELNQFIDSVVQKEKQLLTEKLFLLEEENPGSISLSAGSCHICGTGNCTKSKNKPCRYPEKLRYSIESLGGNVGKTISNCFHIELEWVEEGKLPNYFVLVCALLKKLRYLSHISLHFQLPKQELHLQQELEL